jgi:hypothetical protein
VTYFRNIEMKTRLIFKLMKTNKKQSAVYYWLNISHLKKIVPVIAIALFLFHYSWRGEMAFSQRVEVKMHIIPPPWAPNYDNINHIHFYYLPDIECYYDVWTHDFIYLEDGEWMFGAVLPPYYSWFDLNNAFVVVLDHRVQRPWMHFPYYVEHYPRYYYRSTYKECYNDRRHPIRGFNENARVVVFDRIVERHHDKDRDRNSHRDHHENGIRHTRPSEPMRYEGKEIGRPVEVQQNTTNPREEKSRENKKEKKEDKKQVQQVNKNPGRRR